VPATNKPCKKQREKRNGKQQKGWPSAYKRQNIWNGFDAKKSKGGNGKKKPAAKPQKLPSRKPPKKRRGEWPSARNKRRGGKGRK